MIDLKYKPYTCRLSENLPGVEILYEGDAIIFVPISVNKDGRTMHQMIVDALNGAFINGRIFESMDVMKMIKEKI